MHLSHPCEPTDLLDTLSVLGGIAVSSTYAAFLAGRMALKLSRPVHPAEVLGQDLLTYDGLRALMVFAGWMGAFSVAAMLAPCWFLDPAHYIGLWYWLGAPLAILLFLHWIAGHDRRRQQLLDASRQSNERSLT